MGKRSTMDMEKSLQFYELFEKLADATQIVNQKPDIPFIESIVNTISAMFRLCKGVTRVYKNPGEEERGEGETLISYDLGIEGKPVHTVRFVTRLLSITTMTVYMAEDEEPLTEDELFKVDLTMRTTLAFISRNRLQGLAENMAFYDDSGYRNLRSFFNFVTWKGQPGGLDGYVAINYNLKNFSLINDELGRETGDRILFAHYEHVSGMIGDDGILSRLGGDAFVVVCRKDMLNRLLEFLTEGEVNYNSKKDSVTLTAWVGVFVIPDGFSIRSPGEIMGRIMPACMVAKNRGLDNVMYYSDAILAERERSKRVQQEFPRALKRGEFQVFYQPKVNIFTGEICGGEALSRWIKNGKVVSPAEFIPALEETNDICKLDFYALDVTCKNIRKWLDEGRKAVRVSVNLSRRHIVDDRLVETIIEIIDRHKVPHEYIEIELTETTTDVEFKSLQQIVAALQAQNIRTSVDDFGMGYSSLNLIRVIPWNVLKVDRSFLPLDDEDSSSIRSIMFRHVVSMVRELGLECIAEGVETKGQLNVLKENNCEQAQGFLFDRPLPLDEFEKRLDAGKYDVG